MKLVNTIEFKKLGDDRGSLVSLGKVRTSS